MLRLSKRAPATSSSAQLPSPSKNEYRPDIDGLRALAVLPVILFHANLFSTGGFIGVDVFFVISGYLITQIIERELKEGSFSLLVFYQRRMRRIFPALFAMFAGSTAIAFFGLPPKELQDFGESLQASAAFYSNILFYQQSGYFAPQAELQPFLHTWTLAVEEQFYFCWPLLLMILNLPTISKLKVPASLAIFFGSLWLSTNWVAEAPNAAFYLLPSRAWELALGALLCLPPVSGRLARLPRTVASVASLTGIFMLGVAVIAFNKLTPFPGLAALLPCLGAALIIAAGVGGPSTGGKLLSLRPFVWTGLISYSLYLWHWPILFFGGVIVNHKLDLPQRCFLVVLTFFVAWLSWRFVETPFRHSKVVRSESWNWVKRGLWASASFAAIGSVLFIGEGFPGRRPDIASWIKEQTAETTKFQNWSCLARGETVPDAKGCLLGAPSATSQYEVVLWGDSHATQLAPGINNIGQHLGVTTRLISKAGCGPIPGVKYLPLEEMRVGCPAFNDAALKAVLENNKVRVVVLAAHWAAHSDGGLLLTFDGQRPTPDESRQRFVSSVGKLVTTLVDSGRQVILVGQTPIPSAELVACIYRARFIGRNENMCSFGKSERNASVEHLVNQVLDGAVSQLKSKIQILRPYDYLCSNSQGCILEADGKLLYMMDNQHLSANGVRLLEPDFEKLIKSALVAVKSSEVSVKDPAN